MPQNHLMTNKEVLLASGVTEAQYNAIMTADAQTAVNLAEPIHNVLMSFVNEQRIEWANLDNPLKPLEQSYASLNGGSLNGLFQETLIPPNPKGTDGLYGGNAYDPTQVRNPYGVQNYGTTPIQYTYGINEKIERYVTWDRADFLMALKNGSLIDYVRSHQQILRANANGSEYVLENKVLNCEKFQYLPYAQCPIWSDAQSLSDFMKKVYTDQAYPEANMTWKKTKFNTTRRNGELVFVLDKDFFNAYADRFQFSSYLKPFMYRSQDSTRFDVQAERSRIIMVDALTPTTLATNEILVPRNLAAATLPANTKLVGRIVDMNAVKFGMGINTAIEKPLSSRKTYYEETQDYCLNMCDAYVNVPILVKTDFNANRIIYTSTQVTQLPEQPDPSPTN